MPAKLDIRLLATQPNGRMVATQLNVRMAATHFFFFFLESIRLISLRLCGAPVPSP